MGIFILLIAILADWQILKHFYQPYQLEEIKPVLHYVTKNIQKNDIVYVNYDAAPAFNFYTKYHSDKNRYRYPNSHIGGWGKYANTVKNRQKRMWLIFSHETKKGVKTDLGTIQDQVKIIDSLQSKNASCYLVLYKK